VAQGDIENRWAHAHVVETVQSIVFCEVEMTQRKTCMQQAAGMEITSGGLKGRANPGERYAVAKPEPG
jgi:hypothetical protein